jgi:ABC-type histidine transport system ATPase subunit
MLEARISNSKDLEEAVRLLKDAWDHMPPKLQGAIVKVMRDSIENGETFIKSAREYELTEGVDNG